MIEVSFLSQAFEFIPEMGVSGYVKVELCRSYTLVDGGPRGWFLYQRHSWSSDPNAADFAFLREIPFGFAAVSGA